jgi:hypothetical protein
MLAESWMFNLGDDIDIDEFFAETCGDMSASACINNTTSQRDEAYAIPSKERKDTCLVRIYLRYRALLMIR